MSGRLWFRARRYGWGWQPATWQGWLVFTIYAVAVIAWVIYLAARDGVTIGWHFGVSPVIPVLSLTIILIAICWMKGERPRWRWGK